MPVIDITMWSGRTLEQKRTLARAITDDMVKILGVREESLQIIFHEIDKHNWAIGGKIPE